MSVYERKNKSNAQIFKCDRLVFFLGNILDKLVTISYIDINK